MVSAVAEHPVLSTFMITSRSHNTSLRSHTHDRDFNAPSPCPYDASAGTIAACGLLRLASLLLSSSSAVSSSKALGEKYLKAAFDLITAILLHCAAPRASLADGRIDWGEGGWETILMHSTINGNPRAARRFMDHGLVCE